MDDIAEFTTPSTSPNILNYHIGKGIVSLKELGVSGGAFIDLGNCTTFRYSPTVTKLDHFTARLGVKTKDFTAIAQVAATVEMLLDEITPETLSLFALGAVNPATTGDAVIGGLSKANFTGTIKVVGTNDVGHKVDFQGDVRLSPTGNFEFITSDDKFSVLTINADVIKDAGGNFGIWTVHQIP